MHQRNIASPGFIAARLTPALLISLIAAGSASAATLSVGPGKTYSAPCAAFNAAKDGDIVEIAGNNVYKGDVCGISRSNLTIRGVNGRPVIDANGANAMGKGIWVVGGNNITIENVEMLGAKVPDQNGAALRLEGTGFTLRQSFLHDNENGILSGANTASDIVIEYTEFGHNGFGDGYTHNLYIGNVKSLTFRYNYSHDANVGHNLKSRAQRNTIYNNRFSSTAPGQSGSTATGAPSYEIDLPNAGTSYLIGNVIEQPAANSNPNIVAYGEEGASNPGKDLYVVNNTFLNDSGSGGTFVMIGSSVTTPALLQNNIFAGVGSVTNQGNASLKTNYSATAPAFVNRAGYDLHPASGTPMINAGSAPGNGADGFAMAPIAQYVHVTQGELRNNVGQIDIGAYEATGTAAPAPAENGWTQCASEGGTCSFSGTHEVRYGSGTTFVTRMVTGAVACSNAVFGDPTPNVAKTCSYSSVTWTQCANEGGTCSFSGTHEVRYGSGNTFVSKTVNASTACSNAVFGDPTPQVAKTCSYANDSAAAAPVAESWTDCAGENGTCTFSGTRDVRYGTASNFVTRSFTGLALCSNEVFGDPALGVVKSCKVSNLTK